MSERYTLSSLPSLGALVGVERSALLTGVEDDPTGALRAYLGPRWKWLYILIEDEDTKEAFRRAWGGGALGHVWLNPVPPPEAIHHDLEGRAKARAEAS